MNASSSTDSPTWIACLTPAGQGALATLGLCGPAAWDAVRRFFRPRKGELPDAPPQGGFWLGHLGSDMHDDAVLTVKRNAPECWLELHVHGGREIVHYLHDLFVAQGLRSCTWQAFLQYGSADSLQAQAAIALAEAPTTRTAAILLDQYHGAFQRALASIHSHWQRGDLTAARSSAEQLVRYTSLGRHLTTPWRVVIAGAPNVGKSSLLNALAGYQRSIVAPTPGTTRDLVTVRLAIDGWPVEFVDTAGMRDAAESLEGQGIEQAKALLATADLCLWVLDASVPAVWPDPTIRRVCLLLNKTDLPPAWNSDDVADVVRISAATGAGLPDLCERISTWLVPDAPPPGAAVPFAPDLCDEVQQLLEHLPAEA